MSPQLLSAWAIIAELGSKVLLWDEARKQLLGYCFSLLSSEKAHEIYFGVMIFIFQEEYRCRQMAASPLTEDYKRILFMHISGRCLSTQPPAQMKDSPCKELFMETISPKFLYIGMC